MPINPIEEKDKQNAALKKALEVSNNEVSDTNALKDCSVKARNEVKT